MKTDKGQILVVDDDDILREFYVRVFANLGYDAVCASDGDEAVTLLESSPQAFQLVVLDLLMPVKNGWETIDYMRGKETLKDIPIVAITGASIEDEDLRQIESVCDDVILKGEFEMTRLTDAVSRLLGE